VQQLSEHPRLQHEYLHTLFKRDNAAGSKFHERQVSLCTCCCCGCMCLHVNDTLTYIICTSFLHSDAEFAPNQLLAFLRNSQ